MWQSFFGTCVSKSVHKGSSRLPWHVRFQSSNVMLFISRSCVLWCVVPRSVCICVTSSEAGCGLQFGTWQKSMNSSKILECFLLAFIIALDSIDLLMCNIDWLYPALATRAPRKDVNSCCELYSRRTNALWKLENLPWFGVSGYFWPETQFFYVHEIIPALPALFLFFFFFQFNCE